MAASIFISYDRADAKAASAVYEYLSRAFGPEALFFDFANLAGGESFPERMTQELASCRVMLVLISPTWAEARLQHEREGRGDLVSAEISAALWRDKRIVPLLIEGASIPSSSQLPEALARLTHFNAFELSQARFAADAERLVADLWRLLDPELPRPQPASDHANAPDDHETSPSAAPASSWALTFAELRARIRRVLRPAASQGGADPAGLALRSGLLMMAGAMLLAGVLLPYANLPDLPGMRAAAPASSTSASLGAIATTPLPIPPAGTRFRDCPDDTCPWMVVIPAGSFTMGSPEDEEGRANHESPQHRVTIRQPFAVMETEVTVAMYRAFAAETGRPPGKICRIFSAQEKKWVDVSGVDWRNPFTAQGFEQGDDHPVVCIDWPDAQAFARWMTRRTGQPYRLLSEAEWEYAARAGSTTRYAFGTRADQLCQYGNVADERARRDLPEAKDWIIAPCDDGYAYTAPVASFRPNAFGLFDMHGNAWEWAQDCYGPYTAADADGSPKETASCERRLLRGGAWFYYPQSARSAFRYSGDPADRINVIGFRLARMLPSGS